MQVDISKEVEETLDSAREDVYWLFRLIPESWFENPWVRIGLAALVLVLLLRLGRRAWRFVRRLRPPRVNAKLAIYGPDLARRRESATVVSVIGDPAAGAPHVALSTGPTIKGFIVTRRVEHLHVAGAPSAEEALGRLREAAAQRGANAVISVRRDLGPGDTYVAAGEAVIVVKSGDRAAPSDGTSAGVSSGPQGRGKREVADDADHAGDAGDAGDGGDGD